MAEAGTDPPQLDMSTAITDSNHGIVVTVVAWICFVASLLFFAARMRIRWPLKSLFGQDDAACTAAMVGHLSPGVGEQQLNANPTSLRCRH